MRYLVDEGVPRAVARWLQEAGHDVLYVVDSPYRGKPDRFLWRLAGEEQRALVTRDLGFLLPRELPGPRGVVVIRTPHDWRAAHIALLVTNALQTARDDDLIGYVTIIEPGRTRRRMLSDL